MFCRQMVRCLYLTLNFPRRFFLNDRLKWVKVVVLILTMDFLGTALLGEETPVTDLLSQARDAYRLGQIDRALFLADRAINKTPLKPQGFFLRGWLHEMEGRHHRAIADYDQVLKLDPSAVDVYNHRGSEYFKLGNIEASIVNFEKAIKLDPKQEPYHWQRGISYYYAGRYEEGRNQFKSHQQINSNDVENSVWHFLCTSRLVGVSRARRLLLRIEKDSRIPMMEVYRLFAGEGTAEKVMVAAREGNDSKSSLQRQLFYANLYLGLYYEAFGDEKKAREHIVLAADNYPLNHYMGDVARIHAEILQFP